MNSEVFLQKYRVLEGLLEKRYEGKKITVSVVIEYIRDIDSQPVRVDLDLMREIRNILSHNAGPGGEPVVEPSDETLRRLDEIIEYVKRPRRAADLGTPADKIYFAHLNDSVVQVMRGMHENGYSHVPITERGSAVGVFSVRSLFDYLAENGLDAANDGLRVCDLRGHTGFEGRRGVRYVFVSAETSVIEVRAMFQRYTERNRRLSAVFVTENGDPGEKLICMLTPWDVLSDQRPSSEEDRHESGKEAAAKR